MGSKTRWLLARYGVGPRGLLDTRGVSECRGMVPRKIEEEGRSKTTDEASVESHVKPPIVVLH